MKDVVALPLLKGIRQESYRKSLLRLIIRRKLPPDPQAAESIASVLVKSLVQHLCIWF